RAACTAALGVSRRQPATPAATATTAVVSTVRRLMRRVIVSPLERQRGHPSRRSRCHGVEEGGEDAVEGGSSGTLDTDAAVLLRDPGVEEEVARYHVCCA